MSSAHPGLTVTPPVPTTHREPLWASVFPSVKWRGGLNPVFLTEQDALVPEMILSGLWIWS